MTTSMRQLEERHMATKVELMVWSNKMDLLALSNAKGQVALHRLTWQKVWSLLPINENETVKGLAWRPDDKVIAVGYSNNDVLLVSVEKKDIIHTLNCSVDGSLKADLSLLIWLEEKGSTNSTPRNTLLQEKASIYLPELPPICRTYGSISEETNEEYEDAKKIIDQNDLNFLIVVLSNGRILISVFGIFSCGIIQLPEDFGEGSSILSVEISSDLKNIYCLVLTKGEVKLVTYNTLILSSFSREIHALAYKYGQIISLMDYLDNTIRAITEAYENILLIELESKLSQCADSRPEGSVSADFLELLMFGVTSDPLENFLLQELTDKGIKKLSTSIESSHFNIQKLILKHLHAVGENIAFHLSDLRGMARLTERFKVLGLDEFIITQSFTQNGAFLAKANEVSLVIDDSLKKYKALFKWLYEIVFRLSEERVAELTIGGISEQEIAFIADYLYNLEGNSSKDKKKHGFLDHLGQYFLNHDLTNQVLSDKNPWEMFLEETPCIKNNPLIITRNANTSLIQEYEKLQEIIKEAFIHPQNAIGDKINVSSITNLVSAKSLKPKVSMKHILLEDKLIISLLADDDVTHFVYIAVNTSENTVVKNYVFFKSHNLDLGLKPVDLQIYTKDLIATLLERQGKDRDAIFLLMPVKAIHELSVANHLPDCYSEGFQMVEPAALRPIDNMIACKLAVSEVRKVAVLLSENMHKVRMYEMEVEEDEEDEDIETTKESDNSTLQQSI